MPGITTDDLDNHPALGPQPPAFKEFVGMVFHDYEAGILCFRTPGGGIQRGIAMRGDGIRFNKSATQN